MIYFLIDVKFWVNIIYLFFLLLFRKYQMNGQEECWVKEGSWEAKSWPDYASAYVVSKASLNAYKRLVAKKYPFLLVNCVCPGYVKTDMNHHYGVLTVDEGAESASRFALLASDGLSGLFFVRNEVSTLDWIWSTSAASFQHNDRDDQSSW